MRRKHNLYIRLKGLDGKHVHQPEIHIWYLSDFNFCTFGVSVPLFLQLHTADIGGQGTTLEVVQSIMRIIQSKGQLTAEL